jgi:hypothetical protein
MASMTPRMASGTEKRRLHWSLVSLECMIVVWRGSYATTTTTRPSRRIGAFFTTNQRLRLLTRDSRSHMCALHCLSRRPGTRGHLRRNNCVQPLRLYTMLRIGCVHPHTVAHSVFLPSASLSRERSRRLLLLSLEPFFKNNDSLLVCRSCIGATVVLLPRDDAYVIGSSTQLKVPAVWARLRNVVCTAYGMAPMHGE